jgi:hypothetical protein
LKTDQRYLTRRQAVEFLNASGYPFGYAQLSKVCAPAVGAGPVEAGRIGLKAIYEPQELLRWAESRIIRRSPAAMSGTSSDIPAQAAA